MRVFATVREAPAARPPRRASHPRARPGRAERAAGVPAVRGGPLLAGELRHGLLQRCGDGRPCACSALDEVGDVLRTPGTALASPVKEDMEARFGADFSHVRIHQGTAAAASARAVDALAYTVGSHIVFGEGQPATGRLLAHELAHVLQQGTGESAGPLRVEDPGAPAEREAAVG